MPFIRKAMPSSLLLVVAFLLPACILAQDAFTDDIQVKAESVVDDQISRIKALEEELRGSASQVASLSTRVADLESDKARLLELGTQHQEAASQIRELEHKLAAASTALKDAEAKAGSLEKSSGDLTAQLQQLSADKEKLLSKLEATTHRAENAEASLTRTEASLRAVREELASQRVAYQLASSGWLPVWASERLAPISAAIQTQYQVLEPKLSAMADGARPYVTSARQTTAAALTHTGKAAEPYIEYVRQRSQHLLPVIRSEYEEHVAPTVSSARARISGWVRASHEATQPHLERFTAAAAPFVDAAGRFTASVRVTAGPYMARGWEVAGPHIELVRKALEPTLEAATHMHGQAEATVKGLLSRHPLSAGLAKDHARFVLYVGLGLCTLIVSLAITAVLRPKGKPAAKKQPRRKRA